MNTVTKETDPNEEKNSGVEGRKKARQILVHAIDEHKQRGKANRGESGRGAQFDSSQYLLEHGREKKCEFCK